MNIASSSVCFCFWSNYHFDIFSKKICTPFMIIMISHYLTL